MFRGICYFGSYDPNYARNKIIKIGFEHHGFKVYECQAQGLFITRYFKLTKYFLKNHQNFEAIIVGFPGHMDIPLASALGKIFRKKVFFDVFASTYETYVIDRAVIKKNSASSKFFYFIDWLGLHLADYVIVDTNAHAGFYHKLYGFGIKKQIIVYVGSDSQIFRPRKVKQDTDVLFYGSYQPLQGVETIIKAASKLPKVNFKLIGEGQTKKPAQELSKKLNLENVEFLDWLPLEKLAIEIAKSKITLGIFGSSPKTEVVIPNKVYDSLATGKPVITENTRAARELLINEFNAVLIPAQDASALAQKIDKLLKNPNLRQKIARNGYDFFVAKLKANSVVKNLILRIDEE